MNYYPVYLDLNGRRCLVVGGGVVAQGKVEGLLECGADVTVVAPDLTPALAGLRATGRLAHVARAYRPGDLEGAFLVIAATDDRAVHAEVWEEASLRGAPVNVVDDLPHCSFIAPSVLRRGDLAVAVSTAGKAPALAVRLRERLDATLGSEYARFLELVGPLRERLAARTPDFEERKALWYRLVDSDVFDLLRRGDEGGAIDRVGEILGVAPLADAEVSP